MLLALCMFGSIPITLLSGTALLVCSKRLAAADPESKTHFTFRTIGWVAIIYGLTPIISFLYMFIASLFAVE